ncbi:MAG: hypothetical protein GVY32_03965 [Gammaproteobacteria bacterium]|jgi:hypothetical protein|nr:hypothetical protein [Gammaproteobacteria bacterium]
MKLHSLIHPISIPGVLTAVVFATCLLASPVQAQTGPEGPSERICRLLTMLGGAPPACQQDAVDPEVAEQIDALTLSVLPFFNYDVAVAAGWDTILGECVESPAGGMGYHVHNMDQYANGYLNLLRPEVLLYAPTEDGSMRFHGVEYIIPAELWTEPNPPNFLGRDLHFNPSVPPNGIWALHVWVGTPNPEGLFEDWNPEVSCEFATIE